MGHDQIRDRFLADTPEGGDPRELEYFASIGLFIFETWQAQVAHSGEEPIDDNATAHLWNECTEGRLREMRAAIERRVADVIQKRRAVAFYQTHTKSLGR